MPGNLKSGEEDPMRTINGHRKVTLKEAANLLQELGICKAFRDGNKINGPNCYRFANKDPTMGRWTWEVAELIEIALRRQSAPLSLINKVIQRYGLQQIEPPTMSETDLSRFSYQSRSHRGPSRADLEKSFRDAVRTLESLMRLRTPVDGFHEDRRTLGDLIFEFEHSTLFKKVETSEARFVNNIRNTLNHPNLGDVSDDRLLRGLESVRALIRMLQGPHGADE